MNNPFSSMPGIDTSALAVLDSPAFTGTPTGPTPASGDNSARLATTAFVKAQGYITPVGAPVQSVAGQTGAVTLAVSDVTGAAPLASPAFTGSATAASLGINRTAATDHLEVAGAVRATASSANIAAGPEAALLDFGTSVRVGHINGSAGSAKPVDILSGGTAVARFQTNGRLAIGSTGTASGRTLEVTHAAAADTGMALKATASDFGSPLQYLTTVRAASSAFSFLACMTDINGAADAKFLLYGNGNAAADGAWTGGGADYAEYFESVDGTVIPAGTSVVLAGGKVRATTSDDPASAIIGVVRPKNWARGSAVIGNAAWSYWSGKYLTDAFGRYEIEQADYWSWTAETAADGGVQQVCEGCWADRVPAGVSPPPDKTVTSATRPRLNPAWDPARSYTPRAERPEWQLVGLLGQVPVLAGQSVGERWQRLAVVDGSTETWLVR